MSQLPADCLEEIFEYLYEDEDPFTLHSCLLVNRFWCEVSVRILWRIDWFSHFRFRNYSILIACLPNESKEVLHENGIIISSKPPMFNYTAFCKDISIGCIDGDIREFLQLDDSEDSEDSENRVYIVVQEILKMFINQVSLKKLRVRVEYCQTSITIFTTHPKAKDCLKNLSALDCRSKDPHPEFFYQLSQICHNIQTISIIVEDIFSDGLLDLIFSQNNLKFLDLWQSSNEQDVLADVIPSLVKLFKTFISLEIIDLTDYIPYIFKFKNLRKLKLSFYYRPYEVKVENKVSLQVATFPQLEILSLTKDYLLIDFLRNNGKNLKELDVMPEVGKVNPVIADCCPNLKRLSTFISYDDLENLKEIFVKCQYLEDLNIYCKIKRFNELLKIISKYSPKSFYKLLLRYSYEVSVELLPEELESFFIDWSNRTSPRSLSLLFSNTRSINNSVDKNEECMKIIEKYIKLGIIRNFKIYVSEPEFIK